MKEYILISLLFLLSFNCFGEDSKHRPSGEAGKPETTDPCATFVNTPDCPINRCYPKYYDAFSTYASGLTNCIEAIDLVQNCSHQNLGSMPAVTTAGNICMNDKTISKTVHQKAKKEIDKCKKESTNEGGTLGKYIRVACTVDSYKKVLKVDN